MIAVLFLVLLHLDVARSFSKVYSQWKCAELPTLPQYVTASYFFVLRESCELYISTRPITEQLYHKSHSKCSSRRKYILFAWENDQIAILRQTYTDAQAAFLNPKEMLSHQSHGHFPITDFEHKFLTITRNQESKDIPKIMYETCHRELHDKVATDFNLKRLPEEQWYRCYSLSGTVLTEQTIQYDPLYGIIKWQRKFTLPKGYSYGHSIASYRTEIGVDRLWMLNGKTLYDFDLSKVGRGARNFSNPLIYNIPDEHRFKTTKAEIIFADEGSVITKRCYSYNNYKISGCLYRYNMPRGENTLTSLCIYDELFDIQPGLLSKTFKSGEASGVKETRQDGGYDSIGWKDYNIAYAPVQILGLITAVYLCLFFYCAFKPNPHSDLTELSKVMDEQLYQLSILTKEVAETMRRKKKQVILKRRETDVTQASLEICSPGTTHRSSYENVLRSSREEAAKRKPGKEVHRSKEIILKSHDMTKARSKEPLRASAGVLTGAHVIPPYQRDREKVGHRAAEKRINIEKTQDFI